MSLRSAHKCSKPYLTCLTFLRSAPKWCRAGAWERPSLEIGQFWHVHSFGLHQPNSPHQRPYPVPAVPITYCAYPGTGKNIILHSLGENLNHRLKPPRAVSDFSIMKEKQWNNQRWLFFWPHSLELPKIYSTNPTWFGFGRCMWAPALDVPHYPCTPLCIDHTSN